MNVKIHYRLTQDRAGLPREFTAARRLSVSDGTAIEEMARTLLAADYQVPHAAVEILKIEH